MRFLRQNGDAIEKATVEAMLTRMFREMDPDVEYTMRHPDFQADMPQSGERFSTREKKLRDILGV